MKLIRGKHFSEPPVVRAHCESGDILAFGYTHISTGAPDLLGITTLQKENTRPLQKIRLKHSDEIRSNYLGCCTTRMPRTSENDELPVECVHLIDGDPDTCWLSKNQPTRSMTPVWIRVDLPVRKNCDRIVLRKKPVVPGRVMQYCRYPMDGAVEVGRALPGYITAEVSQDGCSWTTVFSGQTHDDDSKEFFEIRMAPCPVLMLRITGTQLVRTEDGLYCFSIAAVELYDTDGSNAALLSRGASVSVNSTVHSHGETMETQRALFPVHYDLGCKWVRVGYHDDVINWHWVERKKGELKIDPYADATITELHDNGVEILFCLNFGNRLYSGYPERRFPQMWEFNYEPPQPPVTEEALQAWERYCRFMVRHFRDRVHYFEVWNEWNLGSYWGAEPNAEDYLRLAKRTIPIIREEAPEAKVVLGSMNGFPFGCREWDEDEWKKNEREDMRIRVVAELATSVDVIGYHPFYNTDPEKPQILHYDEDVEAFVEYCRRQGFKGSFSASEFNFSRVIPPFEGKIRWGSTTCTELQKAVYTARLCALHMRRNITSLFCETFATAHTLDLSLFRRSTVQDPMEVVQPQIAYYMLRNMCSYFDGAEGCEGSMQVSGAGRDVQQTAYIRDGEKIYGAWLTGRASDEHPGEAVRLIIDGEYTVLTAFDPVDGVEQELECSVEDGKTCVNNWIMREYPTFIRCR